MVLHWKPSVPKRDLSQATHKLMPVTSVQIVSKEALCSAGEEKGRTWLTDPVAGTSPMVIKGLSKEPPSQRMPGWSDQEKRVICTLRNMLKVLRKSKKRVLPTVEGRKTWETSKRNLSIIVKPLSPAGKPRALKNPVVSSHNLNFNIKPTWLPFQNRSRESTVRDVCPASVISKKRPAQTKNPSLIVKALSPYSQPDIPGARRLVVSDDFCENNVAFSRPGRCNPSKTNLKNRASRHRRKHCKGKSKKKSARLKRSKKRTKPQLPAMIVNGANLCSKSNSSRSL